MLASVVAVLSLGEDAREGRVPGWDTSVLRWVHTHSTAGLDRIAAAVTALGAIPAIAALTVAALLVLGLRRRWRDAAFLAFVVVGEELLNPVLKALAGRPRPHLWDSIAPAGGFGFPSGHAMGALSLWGALGMIAWSGRRRLPVIAVGAPVVVAVGLSRVVLGVHYPSDVLGGWSAGVLWLAASGVAFARPGGAVRAWVSARSADVARAARRIRGTSAEAFIAVATGAIGTLGIVSAMTPGIGSRLDTLRAVVPPDASRVARFVVLAAGLALIWLARALAERRRRAWQLAVALVALSPLAYVAHGLDIEEALVSTLLLAGLLRYRARFDVPPPADTRNQLVASVGALSALAAVLAAAATLDEPMPGGVRELVQVAGFLLAVRVFTLWLRPLGVLVRDAAGERRRAHAIVSRHGRDSLAFFALRRDKDYFFSDCGTAFLAYRVVGSTALVSGDPIGDTTGIEGLVAGFRDFARAHGWRVAILGASGAHLETLRGLGMRAIRLGDEAIIRPETFSLDGRPIRKVRQSVTRLAREGYSVRILSSADLTAVDEAEIASISRDWLGASPERGFTMALDEVFGHEETHFALAIGPDGRPHGFLHLVPAPASGGVSLSAMRRRRDTPNGLMEFVIVETVAWARERRAPEVSLNFCVFTHLLAGGGSPGQRAIRFALRKADRLFQVERLLRFNRKFFPEWRTRYVLFERVTDVPFVGLAFLRLERLLTPPKLWGRPQSESRGGP